MARPDVRLMAVTHKERHVVVDAINTAISDAGGWIDDVNFFSNVSATVACTIPPLAGKPFGDALVAIGLRFYDGALAALVTPPVGKTEMVVTVNVTFAHNEPDLRQTILAVPG